MLISEIALCNTCYTCDGLVFFGLKRSKRSNCSSAPSRFLNIERSVAPAFVSLRNLKERGRLAVSSSQRC
jgi:hypothetical protein